MEKIGTKEFSRKGHEKRWAKRYEILVELSKFGSKSWQNKLINWPTKYLEVLVGYLKNGRGTIR